MEAAVGPEIAVRPISAPALAYARLVDFVAIAARLALRRRRDRRRVMREYDHGAWGALAAARAWEQAADLIDFLVGRDDRLVVSKVGGRVVRIPRREYYRIRMRALEDLMQTYAGPVEPLVELGCGFGYNLFSLVTTRRWPTLLGFDISSNAVTAARQIATHFGVRGAQFDLIDVTEPGHPGFASVTGRTVFTYFVLEQVPRAVPQVLENLLAAEPRRVIHIEPAAEFLDLRRPGDWSNYLYIRSVDYQRCLRSTVRTLAGRGAVRILEERRLDWAPTIHNDGSLIVWEPRDRR
jgi:hypothetical protein